MSRVLVIGGAGFLGYHLVDSLLESGNEVKVHDIIPREAATKLKDFGKDIDYVWKSTLDVSEEDFKGIDNVVHLAAQADVPLSITSPKWTWIQNTESVLNLLEVLKRKPCKSIFMSSDAVYGRVPEDRIPIKEEEPFRPTNAYGASKGAMELLIRAYAEQWNLPLIVFRCAGMYGEESRPKQVIPTFIRQALGGEDITVEGTGEQTRDFNYVKNTIYAMQKAMKPEIGHGVWNIGSGKETSIRELAEMIIKITGSNSKIVETAWRPGEKGIKLFMSIEKAKKELGYEPQYSMEESLKRTIDWYSHL